MPVPQRGMLHWAEPASNHPLEARPHPSSSPVSPSSVPAWARGPEKPNPARNASPLLRGTPKPPARVSVQLGPAERRTRFSRTHLTPTAGSASLRRTDLPKKQSNQSVQTERIWIRRLLRLLPAILRVPQAANAGSWQPPPPPPAQLHPSGPVLPVAVWRAVEAVGPSWTTIPKVHSASEIAGIVFTASEVHTGKSSLPYKRRALTYKLL